MSQNSEPEPRINFKVADAISLENYDDEDEADYKVISVSFIIRIKRLILNNMQAISLEISLADKFKMKDCL